MRFVVSFWVFIYLFSSVAFSQHQNVRIFPDSLRPNEPSIAMNLKNPQFMVAGCNLHWVAYTYDGGKTWQQDKLTSSYIVWGDPVVISDTNSDFYYLHLSQRPGPKWLDRIVCQKSTDTGKTWNNGSFTEVDGKQHDKEWAIVDSKTNTIYMTWTAFDKYASRDPKDSTHILFSKSEDGGETWSKPLGIDDRGGDCIDSDSTVEGAVPTVGPDGDVYVVWSGHEKIYFDKSTDGGETWLKHDKIIANQYGGWNYTIPGIYRCNGLPAIACDLSGSDYRGTIYINYTDQKYGVNDTDVWLLKSTDGGETWSKPIRVNDDEHGNQQFLTWMALDQTNGFLYFVFYDRRNHPDLMTDVYMAVSKDGGETFENYKISEKPFAPNKNVFFGDYNNIVAHNGTIRPIWTRMDTSRTAILTALIVPDSIGVSTEEQPSIYTDFDPVLYQNYPNPFSDRTYVSFRLWQPSIVCLSLYNSKGQIAGKIINNKKYSEGKYVETIDGMKLNLQSGVYYYVLRTGRKIIAKKMLIIE
jgi:hypothetical protein